MSILSVNGISKRYKKVVALDNVSFEMSSGEVLALLGANGAGKSTAMKIICGLAFADSGTVTVNGANIVTDRIGALRNIGAVIENPCFYNKLSAFDNLKAVGIYYGITDDNTINKLLETVGLLDCKKRKVDTFSLGMKQRFGIAQALLNSPKLLILDEPTNGLDPQGIYELRQFIKRLAHEQNIAVLLSSHQLYEVQNTADRVVIMNSGRVVEIKSVEELLHATGDKKTVLISVENVDQTRQTFKDCGYEYKQVAADTFEVNIKVSIADFNRQMITKGVAIITSKEKEIKLEDVFMALTKEAYTTTESDRNYTTKVCGVEKTIDNTCEIEENEVTEEENEKK